MHGKPPSRSSVSQTTLHRLVKLQGEKKPRREATLLMPNLCGACLGDAVAVDVGADPLALLGAGDGAGQPRAGGAPGAAHGRGPGAGRETLRVAQLLVRDP